MYKVLSPAKDLLLTLLAMVDYKKSFVDLEMDGLDLLAMDEYGAAVHLKKYTKLGFHRSQ